MKTIVLLALGLSLGVAVPAAADAQPGYHRGWHGHHGWHGRGWGGPGWRGYHGRRCRWEHHRHHAVRRCWR